MGPTTIDIVAPSAAPRRRHPVPYPGPPATSGSPNRSAPPRESPYPSTPPPGPAPLSRGQYAARRELPYPATSPVRAQHAEDALRTIPQAPPTAEVLGAAGPPSSTELTAYRTVLIATAIAAAIMPLVLLPAWYAADLGPEFTAEGVSGWDVGASTQSLLGLALGALIALAVSAGAVPASDGERVASGLAAAAFLAASAIVWYRVAVLPEPAGIFVREPGLWLATLVSTVGAALALSYAALARITEIERLDSVRAGA